MQYHFDIVRRLIRSLRKPDCGSDESWEEWYVEAWQYITDDLLPEIDSPLDDTKARLYVFALWWFVHDFCAAAFGESSCPELYWHDWTHSLKLDPLLVLVVATKSQPLGDLLSEALICQPEEPSFDEGELFFDIDSEECESDLAVRVCVLAAMRLRPSLVKSLLKGFGDASLLFASLYAATCDSDKIVEHRQHELGEEAKELEYELEELEDDEFDQEGILCRLAEIEQELKPETLARFARDTLRRQASGALSFGNEESLPGMLHGMNGLHWCGLGRVILTGIPSVQRDPSP